MVYRLCKIFRCVHTPEQGTGHTFKLRPRHRQTSCTGNRIPLSMVGRITIIKMVVLPHFLYWFINTRVTLTNSFFTSLRSLLMRLIWVDKRSKIRWDILVLLMREVGLEFPIFICIFWPHSATLSTTGTMQMYVCCMLYQRRALSFPLHYGHPLEHIDIQPLSATSWVWGKLVPLLNGGILFSPAQPQANNPWFPITKEKLAQNTLHNMSLHTFGDLFSEGYIFSRTEDFRLTSTIYIGHFMLQRLQNT